MKYLLALLLAFAASFAHAQAAPCTVTGPNGYNGPYAPSINFVCGNQTP